MPKKKWDLRFMGLADYVATWSQDHGRHVGAVIVGPDQEIRATGYNGIPRGVNDKVSTRHSRENGEKYLWAAHAERNAIYNAARVGVPTKDCTLYANLYPCSNCAIAIIQAGVLELVTYKPDLKDATYANEYRVARLMFQEAGVKVRYLPKKS